MKSSRRRDSRLFLLGLSLCVVVRAFFVAQTDPESLSTPWSNVGDARAYDQFAWNLASEGVLGVGEQPSAFYMPAYSVLAAGIYSVAGHRPGAVRWIQVFLGTAAVVLLARFAGALGGIRTELFALFTGAVYPFFVYFVPEIVTETLFLFAFGAMLLTALEIGRSGRVRDGLLHGAALALAVMTRPIALPMEPACLLLARPWQREGRSRRLGGLALGLGVFVLVWGSWVARNQTAFGEPVIFDTHGGMTFYTSVLLSHGLSHEEAVTRTREDLGFYRHDVIRGTLPGGAAGELEADRRARRMALERLWADPWIYVASVPTKLAELWLNRDLWKLDRKLSGGGLIPLVAWLAYGPILLLGLVGLLRTFRKRRFDFAFAAVWIFLVTSAVFGIFHGGKRYRVGTIDPLLLVLAAWQADQVFRWFVSRQRSLPRTVTS